MAVKSLTHVGVLPPPLNIANTPSSYTFVRLIPFACKFQLVHFECRETVLVDLEAETEGMSWAGGFDAATRVARSNEQG